MKKSVSSYAFVESKHDDGFVTHTEFESKRGSADIEMYRARAHTHRTGRG